MLKGIMFVDMFQVTLLVLDKDLAYPLLLSVNLLFSTALAPSQESGPTGVLPLPPLTQIFNQED
jgi:hypothetical protein